MPLLRTLRRTLVCALIVALGISTSSDSRAQSTTNTAELLVNGPEGALLFVDGQAMGKLPLPVNLSVPAGAHRFSLELGRQRAESDVLTLPANRQAELNLTLSGRALIAVLRIQPAMLLLLGPAPLPDELRNRATESVAAAARQQHAVLLGGERQETLLRRRSVLVRCIEQGDCHEPIWPEPAVSYVLSVQVEAQAPGSGSHQIRAALFDVRTSDFSARAKQSCAPCDVAALAARIGALSITLMQETEARPRGSLTVGSTPDGAKVLIDGRWLGLTPYQREIFTGARTVELQRTGYLPHSQSVQIDPGQDAAVQVGLQEVPQYERKRPLWRLVTGGILLGGGVLAAGFGVSALLANGQCQDGSANLDTCSPYYSTIGIGSGLVAGGAALAITGVVLFAVPGPKTLMRRPRR